MQKNIFKTEYPAFLAPMAGFSDSGLRLLCREQGAAATVSEMVSAKAISMGDRKSVKLMAFKDEERPYAIQLFGNDPDDIAFAAKFAYSNFAPDFIDINMGCPAPKITGGGAGSKLMSTPQLAADIMAAAVQSVPCPVTAKIRAGYDERNAHVLAPMLEKAGASAIFVHGRTRQQMYSPPVDLDIIKAVKQAVSIPVIGNGDISTAEDALKMVNYTGCDGVMVGRGALGNPFLFAAINAALKGEPLPPEPTLEQRMEMLMRQGRLSAEEKGEFPAMREMRKQAPYYMRGVNGAAKLRAKACELETLEDLKRLCEEALLAKMARENL